MAAKRHVLMDEKYTGLTIGEVKEAVDGPYREMHAQPAHPDDNLDGWQRKTGHWSLPKNPWLCVDTPLGKQLESIANATVSDNVTIAKGDYDWRDYIVETTVRLLDNSTLDGWGGPAGVIFRFQDSQRYYAAIIDRDGMAKLVRCVVGYWDVLAAEPIDVDFDRPISIRVSVKKNRLQAEIGGVKLRARDAEHTMGMVGFIGARPCRFGAITVTCGDKEAKRLAKSKKKQKNILGAKRKSAPRPIIWKQLDTAGFGCGRRLRFGDLTGNGVPDILLPRHDPTTPYVDIVSLTAMTLDGDILWTMGKPPALPAGETSMDLPVQINDIDGDGNNEVIAVINRKIVVLDGKTGKRKYSAPVPSVEKLPSVYKENLNHWGGGYGDERDQWPVGRICFADLAGRGARRDVILFDSYHHAIALDSTLKTELWRTVNIHGHFPLPVDLDGDGKDSVLLGYRHVSHDGKTLGRVCMQDHQDAIFCGPLDDAGAGPFEVLMAGGEDGLMRLTPAYDMHQRVMGHVQRLSIGKFRNDVNGMCVATVLFHGNRGIASLFDSNLMRIWTKDFPVIGSTMQPVLFDDSGVEYMFLSGIRPAQGHAGGLIDGAGDLVVPLPDDGGPGLCAFAYDLDGDGLDELITWDYDRIWIYHSDREPNRGRLMKRVRPPLYNGSNFQSYYSLPDTERVRKALL